MSLATIESPGIEGNEAETGIDQVAPVQITQAAVKQILFLMSKKGGVNLSLRIGVKGGGCSGLSYSLGFDTEAHEGDKTLSVDGIKIFVDPKSLFYLSGTHLDFTDGLNGRGFVFNNPNAAKTCGCGSSFGV